MNKQRQKSKTKAAPTVPVVIVLVQMDHRCGLVQSTQVSARNPTADFPTTYRNFIEFLTQI